ncbi:RelA/SpoT domain-containing protein [Xanthobacter sp. DSM 14520]|uniref:RelA/SpoT domain-containing protein n=1 Tax=Xanthobacter autotrophicus (strain ATCC BAA-1158 / Py2) TaxID=78245 RepID=UPI003729068B
MDEELISLLLELYKSRQHDLSVFMNSVADTIGLHPDLNKAGAEAIHSHKRRLKDPAHLAEKLRRKTSDGSEINEDNFFNLVTDLAGVRVLHLFQDAFGEIDAVIRRKISDGDWALGERPKAYTWDPDSARYFNTFDLDVSQKATAYTSVHYLIRPRSDSPLCCELQVRTLFEEIWGEVDHRINYPTPSVDVACREQILVLSKVVGAGSRLLDSLNRVYKLSQDQE